MAYDMIFDEENHITAVKQGGATLGSFVYDADGNRVLGTVGGVTTAYVAGLYEYQAGATTKYYEGGAIRRSGYASGNGIVYVLSDQLGSSTTMVSQAGSALSTNYYLPFGGNRGGSAFSDLTTKRFTGQYHESALPGGEGLSYYNARWYDAQLGRFASADSIVPGTQNPQAFNRYTYAFNSPTNLADPTGHDPRDDFGNSMNDNCNYAGIGCSGRRNPVLDHYRRYPAQIRRAPKGHLTVLRYYASPRGSSGGHVASATKITYPNFASEFQAQIQGTTLGDWLINSKILKSIRFAFDTSITAAHSQPANSNGIYTLLMPDSWHDLSSDEEIGLVAHEVFHSIQRMSAPSTKTWKTGLFVPMQQEREAYIFQFGVQYELNKSGFAGLPEYRDIKALQSTSTSTVANWLVRRGWFYALNSSRTLTSNWDANMKSYGLSATQIAVMRDAGK